MCFLVTFLLLGHFNMMPVILGLLPLFSKRFSFFFLQSTQTKAVFQEANDLDWETFDILVQQQPMQKNAKLFNCVVKCGFSALSVEASAKHLVVISSQYLPGETQDVWIHKLLLVRDRGIEHIKLSMEAFHPSIQCKEWMFKGYVLVWLHTNTINYVWRNSSC